MYPDDGHYNVNDSVAVCSKINCLYVSIYCSRLCVLSTRCTLGWWNFRWDQDTVRTHELWEDVATCMKIGLWLPTCFVFKKLPFVVRVIKNYCIRLQLHCTIRLPFLAEWLYSTWSDLVLSYVEGAWLVVKMKWTDLYICGIFFCVMCFVLTV